MAIPMRELEGEAKAQTPAPDRLPSLAWSLAPIVLPVVLISANTAMTMIARDQTGAKNAAELLAQAKAGSGVAQAAQWAALLGDANLALMLSAGLAVWTLVRQRRMSGAQLAASIETSLLSAGLIILITAAGGAFGAMLNAAKIGPAIEAAMGGGPGSRLAGLALLGFAFVTSSLIKFAQGSSTVAVITTAGVLAAMLPVEATIGFNRVYLATAVASGALVGSWMNDSGFWIFCKMGGLTEVEALKTWTPLLAILGCVSMVTTVALAMLWPMV
jgi:GntP family gluconate:H+ symporter